MWVGDPANSEGCLLNIDRQRSVRFRRNLVV
jgi:hypothetical protein